MRSRVRRTEVFINERIVHHLQKGISKYYDIKSKSMPPGDYFDVSIPEMDMGVVIVDMMMYPKVRGVEFKEEGSFRKKVEKELTNTHKSIFVFCFMNPLNVDKFELFQRQNVSLNTIGLTSFDGLVQFLVNTWKNFRKQEKIKKIESEVGILLSLVNEGGPNILRKIKSIEEVHASYLLQEIGSIRDISMTPPEVILNKTPLSREQVTNVANFFRD